MCWNELPCPKCGELCEGEDLGDHPFYLVFDCECGHSWGQQLDGPEPLEKE